MVARHINKLVERGYVKKIKHRAVLIKKIDGTSMMEIDKQRIRNEIYNHIESIEFKLKELKNQLELRNRKMRLVQIDVYNGKSHMTTWVEQDSRIKSNAIVRFKDHDDWWHIDKVYDVIMEKSEMNRNWHVGGL